MALSIKDNETDALVRRLAAARKLSYTGAIKLAVSNELRSGPQSVQEEDWQQRWRDIEAIQRRSRALPILDSRSDDEILGYGEDGLPE